MNGLTLRVGSKITNKMPTAVLEAVTIPKVENGVENTSIWYHKFTMADSADLQINILKEASLQLEDEDFTSSLIEFLVTVYVEAPLKHPVKCYVAKLILKNYKVKDLFQMALKDALQRITFKTSDNTCSDAFVKAVGVINGCTDNFPIGLSAIMDCKLDILGYLSETLQFFVDALRHSDTISPTEKTTLCTHIHNTARTLLNILHNSSENDPDAESMINLAFSTVTHQLNYLLMHPDVPMDTKTLSSILLLTIMQLLHGNEIWTEVLTQSTESQQDELSGYIHLDQGVILSKYAAILIVVPKEALTNKAIENKNVLIIICDKILEICERSSSEPTIVLSVARTILRLTNILEVIKLPSIVMELAEKILLFVWSHIEFYMDSVRHLSIQIFSNIVKICGILSKKGIKEPLENVLSSVLSLPRNRKGYYVGLNGLAVEIGTLKLLQKDPKLITKVLLSLDNEAIGANVSTLLETLLDKHVGECGTEAIYEQWIKPIIRLLSDAEHTKTSVYQATIQKLIGKVVKLDSGIIDYIRSYVESSLSNDTKFILIFLKALRKAGALQNMSCSNERWKGIIDHGVLRNCLIHPSEEIRTLSISLLAETQKTTELFTETELQLCLWFWKYNINTQSPGFRQLSVTIMKKILRRWESSYYVLERDGIEACLRQSYLDFIHKLREFCFSCLFPGANLSRRIGALQIIVLIENLNIQSITKTWTHEYVDRLLLHLEDTYEINKKLALDILLHCPGKYFLSEEPYTTSIGFDEVIEQARSIKPTDCISAAYKLNMLLVIDCNNGNKICVKEGFKPYIGPLEAAKQNILLAASSGPMYGLLYCMRHMLQTVDPGMTLPKAHFIVNTLLTHLKSELAIAKQNILLAASSGPMYGLLYCMRHMLQTVDPGVVASDNEWTELLSDIIETAFEVNESVSTVVNSDSPEGHLPNDKTLVRSGFNETGELYLSDGSKVTSQMVLLCAWRSVKEVSLLLGDVTSKFHIAKDENFKSLGNLTLGQILRIGQHFTLLLAETKHRGAFEQAYVGFTQLCARLWQCKSAELHTLPQCWLNEQMEAICLADSESKMCATRRSAGVPFMIQALVTTELQVDGNAKCFNRCMSKLFEIACFDSKRRNDNVSIESRIHSLNILKALFKHTALGEIVNPYVSDGLITAIQGFEAGSWAERNSSTLLFSSLMVRIFGVQRTKDTDKLCIRNKMTGRIFFLRYPKMYNFLLEKLEMLTLKCDQNNINQLQPSLYPILLLLSRLYPSSLEGTVSNLKLVAFIPYVLACAKSCVLKIRQLAGRAIVSLISHERYFVQINAILMVLGNRRLCRNLIHGLLLQLVKILEVHPDSISLDESLRDDIVKNCENCLWLLRETLLIRPCYVTANTYVMVLLHLLRRFPEICEHGKGIFEQASETLEQIFLSGNISAPKNKTLFGQENFMCNAFHLHLILLNKLGNIADIIKVILTNINHGQHDLDLITLDILIEFEMRIHSIRNIDSINLDNHLHDCFSLENIGSILSRLNKSNELITKLINIFKTSPVLECKQKSLMLLSYDTDSYKDLFQMHDKQSLRTDDVLRDIIDRINDNQEYNGHIYVKMLNNYLRRADVKEMLTNPFQSRLFLDMTVTVMNSSSCEKGFENRFNAVELLKENILFLLHKDYENTLVKFITNILLWTTLATFLEDDEEEIRCIASDIIIMLYKTFQQVSGNEASIEHVIPSRARELLLDCALHCHQKDCKNTVEINTILLVFALLEFNSEIVSENLIENVVPVAADEDDEPEIRVFDKGEMNLFLEEYIWTNDSMEKLLPAFKSCINLNELVTSLLNILLNENYSLIFSELCGDNYEAFVENLITMSSSYEKYGDQFNKIVRKKNTASSCHPKVKTAILKMKSMFL